MPHIHEKIDFCVETFIVFNNRLLLRVHDKLHKWLSVGGHIELDEDPNKAAIREVKEEVGLDIALWAGHTNQVTTTPEYQELIPPVYMNRHRINATHEHVALVYFATASSDRIEQGETERSSKIHWFTKEELERAQDISPDIKRYGLHALEALSR